VSGDGKSRDQLETVIELDWLNKKKVSNMLIETNWLNMLVDADENKGYAIQADKYDLATTYLDTLVLLFIGGDIFFFMVQQPLVGQGLFIVKASRSHADTPHSVRLLLTETSMTLAGFDAAIPASEWPQTHTFDRAAIGIGSLDGDANMYISRERKRI
jgi:hypothetical protein